MENDPAFSRQPSTLPLNEYREKIFLQVKRLFCYNPVPDEELYANPIKEFMLTEVLGVYDISLYSRYSLNLMVCGIKSSISIKCVLVFT